MKKWVVLLCFIFAFALTGCKQENDEDSLFNGRYYYYECTYLNPLSSSLPGFQTENYKGRVHIELEKDTVTYYDTVHFLNYENVEYKEVEVEYQLDELLSLDSNEVLSNFDKRYDIYSDKKSVGLSIFLKDEQVFLAETRYIGGDNSVFTIWTVFEIRKNIDDLKITKFEIPLETKALLEEYLIYRLYEIGEKVYVVYQNEDDSSRSEIVVLNKDYNILYTIEDIGIVTRIFEAHDNNIFIYQRDSGISYNDLYNENGDLVFRMNTDYHFYTDGFFSNTNFMYLGDGSYIFIRQISEDENNKTYNIVRIDEESEEVIYSFQSQYRYAAYELSDSSFIIQHKRHDDELDTLVHLDSEGSVILKDELNLTMGLYVLSDGYFITTFEGGYKYGYTRRDLESNDLWSIISVDYMRKPIEDGSNLILSVSSSQSSPRMEEKTIDMRGRVISFKYEEERPPVPHKVYPVSGERELRILYESRNGEHFKIVELVDRHNEVLMSKEYSLSIQAHVNENYIYVYDRNDQETLIDVYSINGNYIRSDSVQGKFFYAMDNGNYLVKTESSTVKEITPNDKLVWELDESFDGTFSTAYAYQVSEHLLVLSNVVDSCPMLNVRSCPVYTTYLLDEDGNVIVDYSEEGNTFVAYDNGINLYIYTSNKRNLDIYDHKGNLVNRHQVLLKGDKTFYYLEGDTLTTIEFPEIIAPSWYMIY